MQKPFELELTCFDRSKENWSGEVSVKKTVWKKLPRVLQEKDAVKYHTSGQKHAFDLEKQRFSLDLNALVTGNPHPPHPGETWGIRQLKGKKEENAPP